MFNPFRVGYTLVIDRRLRSAFAKSTLRLFTFYPVLILSSFKVGLSKAELSMKNSMSEKLDLLLQEAEEMLERAKTSPDIEEVRVKTSGRKGSITALSKELGGAFKRRTSDCRKSIK